MSAGTLEARAPFPAPASDARPLLEAWHAAALPDLPAPRDRHLITGQDGERYLFDTRSGLSVQLSGPALDLIEALLAGPERAAELADEIFARHARSDVLEAMEQCTAILEVLR